MTQYPVVLHERREFCREAGDHKWEVIRDGQIVCSWCFRWEADRAYRDPLDHPYAKSGEPTDRPANPHHTTDRRVARLYRNEYGLPAPEFDIDEAFRNLKIVAALRLRIAS